MELDAATTLTTDVLVVGAGPVGLTLANLLGSYGLRALVAEREADLLPYPRAVGMDDESMRIFQAAGLAESVLPHTMPYMLNRFVDGRGELLAEISPTSEAFGWPKKFAFVQHKVDRELLAGLGRFAAVGVLMEHAVEDVKDGGDSTTSTLRRADGTSVLVRASFVVACDGGRSSIRRALGIDFPGTTSSTRWLVIEVNNDPVGIPNVYMGADPERPYASIGLPYGMRRFELMLFEGETDDEATSDAFVTRVLGKLVRAPSKLDYVRRRVYTHHSRIAETFRRGRVLLAGDSAHLMPVWQGQGFNSGVRDAANLAWKLAAICRGRARPDLLDTYDAERRTHAKAMIDLSTTIGRVISPTDRRVAMARDLALRALNVVPPVKRYITEFRFKPMPRYRAGAVVGAVDAAERSNIGRLLVQPAVDLPGGRTARLDDVLGPWFALVVWGNDPREVVDQPARAALDRLGVRLVQVRPSNALVLPDVEPLLAAGVRVVGDRGRTIKALVETSGEAVLLVRPDRIVAAACRPEDVSDAVRAFAAAASCTAPVGLERNGVPAVNE